jgi:hypothetical protein
VADAPQQHDEAAEASAANCALANDAGEWLRSSADASKYCQHQNMADQASAAEIVPMSLERWYPLSWPQALEQHHVRVDASKYGQDQNRVAGPSAANCAYVNRKLGVRHRGLTRSNNTKFRSTSIAR